MKETEDDALKLGSKVGPEGLGKYPCQRSTHNRRCHFYGTVKLL